MFRISLQSHSTICIFTRSHKRCVICNRETKNVKIGSLTYTHSCSWAKYKLIQNAILIENSILMHVHIRSTSSVM